MDAGASKSIASATVAEQAALDRMPSAFASAYAPAPGRTLWAAVYACPQCGHHHLARGRALEALAGIRRARCGRRVWVVIARRYRGGGEGR
ncbi:hypothetical protein [Streptomonospora sp. PA3]|uniref:hypothetical protein n=1 Tax=Streptomonospora sp. PA3 TaxID=2607326 RepID=UPI00164293E3|nr:hypothetical protein [Streptomonospora sp. PA3]